MNSTRHPTGLPFIIANEVAERFSYYGMKAILVVFMTTMLLDSSGAPAPMTESDAVFWYHVFGMGNYFVPIFGALAADLLFGKYRTIIALSLVYCAGHGVLALDDTRIGLIAGLSLIALGSGGIKPCVSAHLGDQYRQSGSGRISEGFSLFYLAINVGAFLSTLLTPWLLAHYGSNVAFAVPGVFMAMATLFFWSGRRRYVALPPTPWREYCAELGAPGARRSLLMLALLFMSLSAFWALFDQTGSSWVLQAERMDREITLPLLPRFTILPSQVQAINPVLILILTPLMMWVVYPALSKRKPLQPQHKLAAGMVLAAAAFVLIAFAQARLAGGLQVSIGWQLLAYAILTASEVMVSITALELAYTHAPSVSKSLVTSFYLLSVALGNAVTAAVTALFERLAFTPDSALYFTAFALLALIASVPVGLFSARSSCQGAGS